MFLTSVILAVLLICTNGQDAGYWKKLKLEPHQAQLLPADQVDPARARQCLLDGFKQEADRKEYKVFSQVGEDGLLAYVFSCVGVTSKTYVEFGTESGSECITRFFREKLKWTGLMMDGSHANSTINLNRELIYAENIAELFCKYNVPHPSFDLLSIDIDLNTFWVLREVLANGYRPRVIIAEINRNFAPHQSYSTVYMPSDIWDGTIYFGASALAYERLGRAFGYSPVNVDRLGVNIILVRDDVIGLPLEWTVPEYSLPSAWAPLHKPCPNSAWVSVGADVPFSNVTWRSWLLPVILRHRAGNTLQEVNTGGVPMAACRGLMRHELANQTDAMLHHHHRPHHCPGHGGGLQHRINGSLWSRIFGKRV